MRMSEITSPTKKVLYATCVTAFNSSTGNRKRNKGLVPFFDASDFAQAITDDNGNNRQELLISKEKFLNHVTVPDSLIRVLDDPETEFIYSPERDSHIMYDAKKDVHYFFEFEK